MFFTCSKWWSSLQFPIGRHWSSKSLQFGRPNSPRHWRRVHAYQQCRYRDWKEDSWFTRPTHDQNNGSQLHFSLLGTKFIFDFNLKPEIDTRFLFNMHYLNNWNNKESETSLFHLVRKQIIYILLLIMALISFHIEFTKWFPLIS